MHGNAKHVFDRRAAQKGRDERHGLVRSKNQITVDPMVESNDDRDHGRLARGLEKAGTADNRGMAMRLRGQSPSIHSTRARSMAKGGKSGSNESRPAAL